MKIQVNTDNNIVGREGLVNHVRSTVEGTLDRISSHITRVEVHLTEESGKAHADNDKRCVMEARLEGRPPVAVTHHAATLNQAIDGAADKLLRMLDSTLEKLHDQRRHGADLPLPEME